MRISSPLRARATTVLVAAGLVLAGVDAAAAQSAPEAAPAAAPAATAAASGTYTSSNRIHTNSFEYYVSPWVGTHVARQRWATPDGRVVARVTATTGNASLDDWPGDAGNTVAGWTYTGSMIVAAATGRNWNTAVSLIIREHTRSGATVTSRSVTTKLRYSFQTLTVSLKAVHPGDFVDIYLAQTHVPVGSSFVADRASLVYSHPASTTPPPPPPPPGDAPSTLGLLAYASGQPTALGDTSKYRYVVVQENQFAHIAEVKRMNPKTEVLAYMNTSTDSRTGCSSYSSDAHYPGASFGVNYCYADRYHPEWFLKDRSGNRLHFSDYPFAMQMDPGSASFADAWAAGVYAQAKADGFDGIWIDDLNVDPGHGLNGRFAKYSDEQFGAATAAWTARVGDYLRSHGMAVIANVGMAPWVGYQLSDTLALAKHLTAVNREHYVRYGDICGPFGERFNNTASNGTPPLSSFLDETRLLQAEGTKITGVDYGYTTPTSDDLTTMTYGRALFLLSWDGSDGSAYFFRRCGVNDTAAPQWTASIGLPAGPIETDGDGIMTRKFQHGVVVLNPNRSGSAAKVSVPAGLHTMSGATEDGGVYVAPQTAAILSS